MKTYKRWMWFLGTIYFPFLFGSVLIGWVVGYGGQKLALILGLHQTNQQNEMVFWVFLAIGAVIGVIGSTMSLIEFCHSKRR
ncbi:hypothetical protein [Vibrio rumoiensis]|uniref:hypothetical protein n=1 Tax=Vibrio rumoiensis TaxID=76258 RepID=UPI000B5C1D64|nr:hypothetical protein [Vibrio rumoiensis]